MVGMEDGIKEPLWMMEMFFGSMANEECRIDSIAQSWAVISGAGEKDKVMTAISNLEKFLIDKETRYY